MNSKIKSAMLSLSMASAMAIGASGLAAAPVDATLVQSLMDMPKKERTAHLKAMSPQERRGLWFEVKRAEQAAKGNTRAGSSGERVARKLESGVTGGKSSPVGKSTKSLSPQSVGTIQYDSGVATTSFNIVNAILGNRFDTHTGIPVLASGTVSTIQAVVVQGSAFTTNSAGFVALGPQTAGGGAMALFSTFGPATGATDTVTFSGLAGSYTGSSFFVLFGAFNNSYVPAFGTGTNLGQGHHGVIGYTGGMGPNITGTAAQSLNALVRTTGNIVPVELMSFDVL